MSFAGSARRSLGAAAVLAAGPLLFALAGTPFGQSYGFNMAWLTAFEAAQAEGTIYPRHLPELMFGLGGLDFFFYGPLPFFVAAGPATWACPGCSPQTVFGLAGGLFWSASLAACWPLARRFVPPGPAGLACLTYGLLPYHLSIDWAVRQAAGEFAAYAFLPLVVLGAIDMLEEGRAGFALPLGVAGILLCHLPTALLAAHVFGVVALVWAATRPRAAPARLAGLGGLGLVGAALSGLYWLPALALVGDVSPDALESPALQPSAWLFGGGELLPGGRLGAIVALSGLAAAVAAATAAAVAPRPVRGTVALWIALPVALCVLLNTALAAPVWEAWIIGRVQFPFRLMVFADLAAALAAGVLAAALANGGWRRGLSLGGLGALAAAVVAGAVLAVPRVADGVLRKGDEPRMLAAPEYLPPPIFSVVAAQAQVEGLEVWSYPGVVERNLAELRAGAAPADALEASPRHWRFTPEAEGPAVLAIPYWRHLRAATPAGAPVALDPDPAWGRVALTVPDGAPPIHIHIPQHWSETVGAALSLAGICGLVWLGSRLRKPRWRSGPSR